ncbi:FecR family protein [Dyella sp.]|uniref:FecR family protein n=1 Tax=Dyella sp. TaxID=1869338 RepID=UPI002ED1B137
MPAIFRPASRSMQPTANDMLREQAAQWALRLDAGDLSPHEHERLMAWLAQDTAHAPALQRAMSIWRALDEVSLPYAPGRADTHRISPRPPIRKRRRARLALAASAACVLVALGYSQWQRVDVWMHADARTGVGETRDISLSGGSTARLDTGSAIAIRDNAQWREVKVLAGTVSFDVGHADTRPFRVTAGSLVVTDIGTSFQLVSHGSSTQVIVASGLVEIRTPSGVRRVHAGEEAVVPGDGGRVDVRATDVDAATAWMRGRLVFVDRPLRDVVDELNRYYDGHILLLDDLAGSRRVSGVFKTTEPLAALDAIQHNLGMRSSRLGAGLILLQR